VLIMTGTGLIAPGTAVAAPQVHKLTGEDLSAWLDGVIPTLLERDALPGDRVWCTALRWSRYAATGPALSRGWYPGRPRSTRCVSCSGLVRYRRCSPLPRHAAGPAGPARLDTDVRSYLDFPLELPKGPVTLRHLLSDTAGFEKSPLVDVSRPPEPQPDLRAELTAHPPRQIFPPGTTPVYSNYGYTLAGYLVQRMSGQRFEQYVQAAILDPLRMSSSSFEPCPPACTADSWPPSRPRGEPVRLDGHEVSAAIPVAVAEGGNTTVYFEVLSYAGVLTIAAVVDADHGPDPDDVVRRPRKELDLIMAAHQ
jgi:Beta-lactamase/WS/DGAT C-terminal domain